MAAAAIELESVTKRFRGHLAVDHFDLSIPEGSIFGFIGPNGSGKTTTLRMILRIIEQDEGVIRVFGRERGPSAVDDIGYLPEERGLYRKMTVLRQLMYFAILKGMKAKEARRAALEWLDRFDLTDWKDKKLETLSKGMSQKIQFIATAVARPRLLILDEPFSGLDPVNREAIRESLLEMKKKGTTLLLSTHDMPTAENLCDHICMIYRGGKVLDGSLREIQRHHGQDTVRLGYADGTEIREGHPAGLHEPRVRGRFWEARLAGESHEALREAARLGPLDHFEVVHPSLQDIFVRIARPAPEEMTAPTAGREESRA